MKQFPAKARSGIKAAHIRPRHAPDRVESGDVMDAPRGPSRQNRINN